MAREIQWDDVRVERAGAGTSAGASWTPTGDRVWSVLRDGQRFKVECLEGPDDQGNLVVRINGVRRACRVLDERTKLLEMMGMSVTAGPGSGDVQAPMPGKVLQVLVAQGDDVEEGTPLLVLEAMKMENVIKATAPGKVASVPVSEGQAVEKGALLVGFEG
jgi:biotin carboxyl carrier protein